jgi:hypothetical protein
MTGLRNHDQDENRISGNFFGFIAALLLVALGLFVLLGLQHLIARRDCYQPHVACAHIDSGRYPHF